MKEILEQLFHHQSLGRAEARTVLEQISEGKFNPYQVSAFLAIFKMRNITIDELGGFRDCLRERCISIDLKEFNPIDLCGTGGDNKNTFNISTLASFVVAGSGIKVAKHSNYGISSFCGSSNVLEYLGYHFTNDSEQLKRQLDRSGICFLHAPLFHPAMKEVAMIRKMIGIHTFFNMLGPMVNPSFPKRQLIGVFSMELLRYYQYIYEQENMNYSIVHSLDGYDEISLTADARIVYPGGEKILRSDEITTKPITSTSLNGGAGVIDAARIFTNILNGNGSYEQNLVVVTNAALAIQCCYPEKTFSESMSIATVSLESGQAKRAFQKLLST